jgi:hypothetical protein
VRESFTISTSKVSETEASFRTGSLSYDQKGIPRIDQNYKKFLTGNTNVVKVLLGGRNHFRKPGDGHADVGDDGPAAGPETQAGVVELVPGVPQLVAVLSLQTTKHGVLSKSLVLQL